MALKDPTNERETGNSAEFAALPADYVLPDSSHLNPNSSLSTALSHGRFRGALAILGPAFVASVAYVDPGNFATNFAAGAEFGYQLVWVILMANAMAILVQYLTSKAGLYTGRSLPELCRSRFGKKTNTFLWIQAELIAMATDLAEFVGAAIGLYLVFGVPLFPAGLITAVIASGFLRSSSAATASSSSRSSHCCR